MTLNAHLVKKRRLGSEPPQGSRTRFRGVSTESRAPHQDVWAQDQGNDSWIDRSRNLPERSRSGRSRPRGEFGVIENIEFLNANDEFHVLAHEALLLSPVHVPSSRDSKLLLHYGNTQ
jgi:hypothetical protein